MTTWMFKQTEPELWTVGFYTPSGEWEAASDHGSQDEAAERVHYLNGGCARTTCSTSTGPN
ncbi:hypothetical protein [Saccharopolyspora griseoalba]|uniref:DUF1508 domain-containing protein n=1 Tax=Saccharopolyspora griseoalba TaxID=1431848 RepID=A0ABW2LTV4_9PSEU